MKRSSAPTRVAALLCLCLPACQPHSEGEHGEHEHHEHHKIVSTSPLVKDVTVTQQYVCLINSQEHINVLAMQSGYIDDIPIQEGQTVKQGDVLFKILPTLYQARLEAEQAEARLAEQVYKNSLMLSQTTTTSGQAIGSQMEVVLKKAELDKANAKVRLAQAELDFTVVRARFDGIVDRLNKRRGSLIKEGDILTTLSDNRVMWVYFNVPEVRYLEYKGRQNKSTNSARLELADTTIELILADGSRFNQTASNMVTVEGQFNNETGNIAFRADIPNPDKLLRHGQTGTLHLHQRVRNAVVIPQRAAFEVLDKQYVWVVGEDKVVHRRQITVAHELEDKFVIAGGLAVHDRFILDGVGQVKENDKLDELDFEKPETALDQKHTKNYAE